MQDDLPSPSSAGERDQCDATAPAAPKAVDALLWHGREFMADPCFDPAAEFEEGAAVAGFTLMEEIGRGGMGVVFRARQASPSRDVAVKLLQPHLVSSPEIRRRVLAEAAAMAEMDHPGILPLYASGDQEGCPWLAMKLAAGGTLSARRREWTGQWRRIAELLSGLADAVQHAHERGLIHRDIKPANVLFDEADRACLADFGLVKWRDSEASETLSQAMLGTPAYLAPEVARTGARAATTGSDIYGLGAVFYELLTGSPPFKGGAAELLQRIVSEEPPPPRRLMPEIPGDLEIVCQKAMAKEPAARYGSAAAFAGDLRKWLKGENITARRFSRVERMVRWSRRHPLPASLTAALVAVVIAGSTALWVQNRNLQKTNKRLDVALSAAEDRVAFMVRHLPRKLEPIGRLEILNDLFKNVQEYYDRFGEVKDPAGLARQAEFYIQWALVVRPQGQGDEARRKLDAAVERATLASTLEGAGVDAWIARTSAFRRRGEHASMEDDYEAAKRYIKASIEGADTGLEKFPGNPLLAAEKADALVELGDAARIHGEPEDLQLAEGILGKALVQWGAIVTAASHGKGSFYHRARRQETHARFQLGRVQTELEKFPAALETFRMCLASREQLAQEPPESADDQQELANACNRIADILLRPDYRKSNAVSLEEVNSLLLREEKISASLAALDPANIRWQAYWGLSALAMGHFEEVRGDADASRKCLETAIGRIESVNVSAFPDILEAKAHAHRHLAQLLEKEEKLSDAWDHWQKSLEAAFENLKLNPFALARHSFWDRLMDRAMRNLSQHETPEAVEQYLDDWVERIQEISAGQTALSQQAPSPWWRRDIASVHRRRADFYTRQGQRAKAAEDNRVAFTLRSELLATEPRAREELVKDVISAARNLLNSGEDADNIMVAHGLVRCAGRVGSFEFAGSSRTEWAGLIISAFNRMEHPALLAGFLPEARRAVYPDDFPRPWNEAELKGFHLMRSYEPPEPATVITILSAP